MKVQVLLAILPFLSTSLAGPAESWESICEATPPVEETVINGQRFKYHCRHQHIGAADRHPTKLDHPNDCAELIASEPNTVISWAADGRCFKAAGPGTKANSKIKILAMEKVEEDDVIGAEDDLAECQADKDDLQRELDKCKEDLANAPSTPPTTPPSTTPKCSETHTQGGSTWKVTCNEVHPGTMIRPVRTTSNLAGCIDLCIAAKSQGCRIAAHLNQGANNCVLYKGSVIARNPNPGAKTAEIQ